MLGGLDPQKPGHTTTILAAMFCTNLRKLHQQYFLAFESETIKS